MVPELPRVIHVAVLSCLRIWTSTELLFIQTTSPSFFLCRLFLTYCLIQSKRLSLAALTDHRLLQSPKKQYLRQLSWWVYYVTCAQHEYVFACSSLCWRFNIQIGWCFGIPASDCLKLCAANFSPEDVGFTLRALVLYWPNAHKGHAVVWSWNAVLATVLSLAELSLPAWMIFGWLIIQIEWLETRLGKNWPDLKSWCKSIRKL